MRATSAHEGPTRRVSLQPTRDLLDLCHFSPRGTYSASLTGSRILSPPATDAASAHVGPTRLMSLGSTFKDLLTSRGTAVLIYFSIFIVRSQPLWVYRVARGPPRCSVTRHFSPRGTYSTCVASAHEGPTGLASLQPTRDLLDACHFSPRGTYSALPKRRRPPPSDDSASALLGSADAYRAAR